MATTTEHSTTQPTDITTEDKTDFEEEIYQVGSGIYWLGLNYFQSYGETINFTFQIGDLNEACPSDLGKFSNFTLF